MENNKIYFHDLKIGTLFSVAFKFEPESELQTFVYVKTIHDLKKGQLGNAMCLNSPDRTVLFLPSKQVYPVHHYRDLYTNQQ